ncbi:GNAT family N-acetyltransferase [Brevundimonas sp. S30B]|uniref:GNAT family N-acetyltransferase n=1 Tax=unclassified Brevundimonas TaxID=2622653 RepID=UPI001072CB9E|nr:MULTISPECIES: GNAT family N-acetyltransferase [unclassified Brevundimonas]QBX36932.1 GNAT family N-acetyltransferase [Brevundimonas sp. MF30-B]TFW04273.1 GNAT family N-acetyltransferase [Brevundimonas sp. S30B]
MTPVGADREPSTLWIGALLADDLPAALALQAAAYPAFLLEDRHAFASRLSISASYCLAAKRGDELLGYLLAHGWPRGSPPAVGMILPAHAACEVLYIHDLAISPAGRSAGIGRQLVSRALEQSGRDGLQIAELIAVQGASSYWRGLGFDEATPPPAAVQKIASYGEDARWMTRRIASAAQGE